MIANIGNPRLVGPDQFNNVDSIFPAICGELEFDKGFKTNVGKDRAGRTH